MKLTDLTKVQETYEESLNKAEDSISKKGDIIDGTLYTTKTEFTEDNELVSKKYVDNTSDYNNLNNKPSINNVTLSGNKTLNDLGIISGSTGITVLYNNPTPTINPQTAALSQPYTDFDFIYITWKLLSNRYNPITLVFRTEDIPSYNENDTIPIDFNGTDGYIKFPTTTSIELTQQPSGWNYVLINVIGINLGARKPYKETVLYSNDLSVYGNQNGSLTASLTDFDAVYYYIRYGAIGGANNRLFTFMLDTTHLETTTSYNAGTLDGYRWDINFPTMDSFSFSTNNQNDLKIEKIIGISYGGSVKGRNETVLYNGGTTATVGEVTLLENALEFDEIECLMGKPDGSSYVNNFFSFETKDIVDNGWQQEYGPIGWYVSNGGTTFGWNNGNGMYPRKIIGIKYDSDYITIDSEISNTSTNPVQNKVIKEYVDNARKKSRTTVYELGMPDFSNAIEITSNLQTCHDNSTPYEILDNGFILLKAWNGYITLWPYNSDDQTPLAISNMNSITSYSSMYTVKKGDKYNVTDIGNQSGGNHYAYFIPVTYSDGVVETREIGTPDYDNRIQFTQADLPYTVPCDGYLYIGGWQSRVSLKYKDPNNEYVMLAHAGNNGAISEYASFPVTKGMVLEYNEINGSPYMYIVPMEYNAMSIGRGVEELYVASDTTAPNTITLSQPYTNFDELMFIRHWGSPATSEASFANVADVNIGDLVGVANWAGVKFVEYTITSTTVLTKNNSGQDGYIYKIYGIKYASKYAEVDNILNINSENPVQNKVLANKINELEQRIIALEGRI